eukprot:UC1_evm1s967
MGSTSLRTHNPPTNRAVGRPRAGSSSSLTGPPSPSPAARGPPLPPPRRNSSEGGSRRNSSEGDGSGRRMTVAVVGAANPAGTAASASRSSSLSDDGGIDNASSSGGSPLKRYSWRRGDQLLLDPTEEVNAGSAGVVDSSSASGVTTGAGSETDYGYVRANAFRRTPSGKIVASNGASIQVHAYKHVGPD